MTYIYRRHFLDDLHRMEAELSPTNLLRRMEGELTDTTLTSDVGVPPDETATIITMPSL